jgi:hypothetical protein
VNELAQSTTNVSPESIEASFESAVELSPLRTTPFDHIYMEQVVNGPTYETLINALPHRRYFHELTHRDAMRADGSSTRLRMYLYPELLWRLPSDQRRAWMPIARTLCSQRLQNAFKRKFRMTLEQRFEKPAEEIRLYPVPILLRDQPGYRIGIHADAKSKAITVQYYLPRDGSQNRLGTIFHEGESGPAAQRTTHLPFMPASGYAFPVSLAQSWHSAAETSEADGERVSMMVTYYVADDAAARLHLLTTRVGLMFGLHPRL